jgi:hypothetical protein
MAPDGPSRSSSLSHNFGFHGTAMVVITVLLPEVPPFLALSGEQVF